MVVRFDLEDRAPAVANVNGAGILTRTLNHPRTSRRQRLEVDARALVAAVLGPHHREEPELEQVGLPTHQLDDAVVLVGLDAVTLENGDIDDAHRAGIAVANVMALTADSRTMRPSALPTDGSAARSG